ncbi:PEP-CTERM sorting domain-containing protein [Sphingomonas gei]|uniref:PEP-CTERM sorting domain-containing protein n=1 Tax=Sphingomonas gei TaxID=1395960 RepID=A0A4S1XB11_9SPHN|nr:PEPxxWA-CTERM sorting domain-containing protein [Sphingomonas gei]TGX53519.1 PEP-CTERM sorting domain-containing protein [Sphingomonas gei]
MPATQSSPLVSELGTERRIVICSALALTLLSLVFRNDRALLLGPGAPGDREASAFTAVVAPPAVNGPTFSAFSGPVAGPRRVGTRAPGIRGGVAPAYTPGFVAPATAPGTSPGAAEPAAAPALPVQLASTNGPARSYTPQMASFIGLPGGVIFGSGNTTPTNPTDPTNPTNPTNPTDPTNPTNPTDPTGPTTPPDPGPGAVPEPVSWALMILGIGMVGASLRRRRAAEPARSGLVAAA